MARKRKDAHTVLIELDSRLYSAFLHGEKVTHSDGALPKKTKELIAAGISEKINFESCMQWHIEQAVKSRATGEKILEAIEVGMEKWSGPANISPEFAFDMINDVLGQ